MQIKKDEIRTKILAVAEQEFFKRGFRNASMRTIASKSHTTLGNLYNYFNSKDDILDAVIGDTPQKIYQILYEHDNAEPITISKDAMENNLDDYIKGFMPKFFPLDILLSKPLLILMDGCEGTKYEHYRQTFLNLFQAHVSMHLCIEADSFIARIIAHGFLSSLLFIGKNMKSLEDGQRDLMNYIKIMVLGFPMPK